MLQPEATVNPALHRFYNFMAKKAMDDSYAVPESDELTNYTCTPQLNRLAGAEDKLKELQDHFPTQEVVRLMLKQHACLALTASCTKPLCDVLSIRFRLDMACR